MIGSERNLTIREISDGDEFAGWLREVIEQSPSTPEGDLLQETRHLALTNEIGDWIGGLRYTLRGGVAHLADIAIVEPERGHGHAFRLLTAFEAHARGEGAHLAEFWIDDLRTEPLLSALGWERRLRRDGYWNGGTWYLMDRELVLEP